MKIFIEAAGDRSVGLNPCGVTIDLGDWCDTAWVNEGNRQATRESLAAWWQEYLDNGAVTVTFEDECGSCGRLLTPRASGVGYQRCANKACPEYRYRRR